jgi:hypothetical protein
MIRCCAAAGVPRFRDGAFEVGPNWTSLPFTDEARQWLKKYSPRFVRIHPDDVGKLAAVATAAVAELGAPAVPVDDVDDQGGDAAPRAPGRRPRR